jgi:putative ABC transport system permease protein
MIADLVAAFRHLRQSPVHVLVVTLSLGIGVAVSVAAFSVIDTLVFRDWPGVADRSGLIRVHWGAALEPVDEKDFEAIEREIGGVFAVFAADGTGPVPVILPSGAVTLPAAFVSADYFKALGTIPVTGRLLTAADNRGDQAPVALIGERLWRESFEASADVLGRTLTITGRPFTIVGVTPAGFSGLLQRDIGRGEAGYPQVWVPLRHASTRPSRTSRSGPWLSVAGRVRPGTTQKRAQAELSVLGTRLHGARGAGPEPRRLIGFPAGLTWKERPFEAALTLGVFLFIPLSVLLIGCANAINLQLARATARSRELGVRIALGASRYRLIRMLAVEAVFLSALAGLVGWRGAKALLTWAAPFVQLPVAVNAQSLVFVISLVIAVIGIAGFAPAWLATRDTIAAGLKHAHDSGVQHKRLRAALVVMQVAISLALLSVSARGVRSLQVWLPLLPPDADMAIVAEFDYAVSHPGQPDSRPFVDDVLDRLGRTPSVAAAGFADFVRMNGVVRYWEPSDGEGVGRSTVGGVVTPGWFDAFGAAFVAGRGFGPAAAPRDAVVNQALASMLPGGAAAALGQTLRVAHPPGAPPRAVEVVGIVADRLTRIDGRSMPAIYLPMPREAPSAIVLVVRASDVPAATAAIETAVTGADPALPWIRLDTLEARAFEPVKGLRETAWFGAGLGTIALLLAAAGLHAVLTYTIRRRTHEIGIRMAIGADRSAIVSLVLRQALGLVLAGAAGGLIITVPLVFVMRMFPNLSPFDPLAMLVPLSMLLIVALLAAAVPAYRAATVDPIVVLREP